MQQSAFSKNGLELFSGRNRIDFFVSDIFPDFVGSVSAKNTFKSGIIQKCRDGDGGDAEVDQSDVEKFESGDVSEEVHDGGERQQVVKDFDARVVSVVRHHVDEVYGSLVKNIKKWF